MVELLVSLFVLTLFGAFQPFCNAFKRWHFAALSGALLIFLGINTLPGQSRANAASMAMAR